MVRRQLGQRRAEIRALRMTFQHEIAVQFGCKLSFRIGPCLFNSMRIVGK